MDEIHGHSHRSTSAVDGGWVVMAKHIRTVVFFVRKTALFFLLVCGSWWAACCVEVDGKDGFPREKMKNFAITANHL